MWLGAWLFVLGYWLRGALLRPCYCDDAYGDEWDGDTEDWTDE